MTIYIYSTPQCGYCKQLKSVLTERKIPFTNHDVTVSEEDLAEMQNLTNGGMSVPVTVVDKGTPKQQVAVGFDSALSLLKLSS